jgi:general secretion pathway protein F
MLRAGEAGGSVDIVLGQLSEYIEKSKELKDTVSNAPFSAQHSIHNAG